MPLYPRRLSVHGRLTLATAILSLIVLTAVAVVVDVLVRDRVRQETYRSTEKAAIEWIGAMGTAMPTTATTSEVDFLQLVDAMGNVVAANPAAAGRPPISTLWPSSDNRIQHGRSCSVGECVLFTATRPSPEEEELLWGGASHVVYSGRTEPAVLGTGRLELGLAAGVLAATALVSGTATFLIRRTLRPVEEMRTRIAEITLTDLGLRVRAPPGRDSIALLAHTANDTLSRLEEAVEQQRHYASMVSHELRTPLTGLLTRLEEALAYPDVDLRATVQDALASAERFQTIIDAMLMLAQVRTATPECRERVDLSALVRDEVACRGAEPMIRARVEDDLQVMGNRVQLAEVLTNLLVNAQRHARTRVEVTVRHSDGQAVVTVADDGKGVAPQDRERVFEAFVRLDEARDRDPGGSGLGLAISRAIAHAHHGTLTMEDAPRGATFALRLPLPEHGG
ncbi:HAMP domain-containing sensor histidine kinase [Nonomuraea antimicrobica]|uniref:histidine kinase n=1 Tax=Nonomuraea antimicrobica TaxID=561173 RepID=A0ABP7CTC5_9ACTN